MDRVIRNGVEWTRVCRSIEVSERHGKRVEIDIEFDLALFRIDGTVYCVTNVCPHKRLPVIYDGFVENGIVTCPMHGWRYDVRTGCKDTGNSKLSTYDVLEADGWIYVTLQ
jgi:nitrite reductase/ring-hydroxylating ferredoxin subunit